MSLTQTGLTGGGNTTNFEVQYDDALPSVANAKAVANALLSVLENEFAVTTGWFNVAASKFGTGNRTNIRLEYKDPDKPGDWTKTGDGGGAVNWGYGYNKIALDPQNANGNATDAANRVEMLFIAEWVEILMSVVGNWKAGDSSGEGLSQYCNIVRFQAGHYSYYGSAVQQWLTGNTTLNGSTPSVTAAKSDWVNQTFTGSGSTHGDGDPGSFGCALAFIYYLNIQLGFTINQIISNYNSNLASVYKAITGDGGDPFPFFLNLISSVYPDATAVIPGPVSDNPFPIAMILMGGRSTFGLDEATDIVNKQGGLVSGGVWIEVQGFSRQSFNALNISAANFTGSFSTLPGVQITPNPEGAQFQAGVNDTTPQLITMPFDITLSTPFLTQNPGSYTLTGSLNFTDSFTNPGTSTVKPVTGGSNSMQFELLAGANPYFVNVDVQLDNKAYLSQDLRVFTATPVLNPNPITGFTTRLTDSITGGYDYIKALLNYLNSTPAFTNPNGTDPFKTVFPNQYGTDQTDSSVTPFTFDFGTFPLRLDNNYNFAVARVRLQGSSGSMGEAKNVRVFFRLFATQTNDTDYDINSTYKSQPDAAGKPGFPLVGTGNNTIPFFATGNNAAAQDYAIGGPNMRDIIIPDHQDEIYQYYGCFLNVYDQGNIINGQPVQALLVGTHNCLVAEIAYDDAPIPQASSPLSWDQLAQRNLQVTLSDNPGPAETHRIPQTFDCRPSGLIVPPGGTQDVVLPDELVIDWGAIPDGSMASIYWPQVNAADVIELASQFYSTNPLTIADSHTIRLAVSKGLSYIPIPAGTGENFAGLFTVDLPPGKVFTDQNFTILVRRMSSKTYNPVPPINTPPATHSLASYLDNVPRDDKGTKQREGKVNIELTRGTYEEDPYAPFSWRYAVGSFQIKIPVTTSDKILQSEENTLAIMKWRLQQMLPSNRWYPVLQRYIMYCSDRVAGLGGDPNSIPPSVKGAPVNVISGIKEKTYSGKVCEIIYDCFGDFEGFVLETCEGKESFKNCEKAIAEICLRACKERLSVSVFIDNKRKIHRIIIRCCC
ncbi:MAG: hypothetical protein ABJB86_16025 [Bacteroidota bacterium]